MGPAIIITSLAFSLYIKLVSAEHVNCSEDLLSLNFSDAAIDYIGRNFVSSRLIQSLNLASNGLKTVEAGAFDNVPNLTHLNMSNNYIYDLFSFGSHPKIEALDLSHQQSNEQIISPCFSFLRLRYLYLQGNRITATLECPRNLYGFAFKNLLPELKYVDLSSSSISSDDIIAPFLTDSLTHLYLHNNDIYYFNLGVLSNLTDLTLDKNRIHDVHPIIEKLPNLKYFSISHNRLTNAEFTYLENLVFLNLSFNELSAIKFEALPQLETLDLNHNRIENVYFLKNLPKLKTLSLNCNRISVLSHYAFLSIPSLSKLYLTNNQISKVHAVAFDNMFNLEELHLYKNKLTSLPPGWSKTMINLHYLNLENNLFHFIEHVSLSRNVPLLDLYLFDNPLERVQMESFRDLPVNLTVHLLPAPEARYVCTERSQY